MINMSVKNIITVTNRGISPILSIAQGTDSVEFDFTVTDYDIPPDSSAVVYNVQPTGNVVNQLCSISGNTISVTPRAYFFLRGKNYMQFRITCNGKNLFSFLIEVWCSPNITEVEVSEVQDPTVVSQVLSKLGEIDLKIDSVDNRLGNRINNIVANNNPTEGNTELIDIRSGYDGTTYPSAGEAVRKQTLKSIKFGKNYVTSDNGIPNIQDLDPHESYIIWKDVWINIPDITDELKKIGASYYYMSSAIAIPSGGATQYKDVIYMVNMWLIYPKNNRMNIALLTWDNNTAILKKAETVGLIDKTLSMGDYAADSKITGENIQATRNMCSSADICYDAFKYSGYINDYGIEIEDSNYRCTGYIEIPESVTEMFMIMKFSGSECLAFYDSDRNFLESFAKNSTEFNENGICSMSKKMRWRFLRVSSHVDNVDLCHIYPNTPRSYMESKNILILPKYYGITKVSKWGENNGTSRIVTIDNNLIRIESNGESTGSFGISTSTFYAENFLSAYVYLNIQVNSVKPTLYISGYKKTDSTLTYIGVEAFKSNFKGNKYIDLVYYEIYKDLDLSKKISFIISIPGSDNGYCAISTFEFYLSSYSDTNLLGETLDETIKNIQLEFDKKANIGDIPSYSSDNILISPDGNKFIPLISNDGIVSYTPIIPSKTLFIGNSLLIGWGTFGMCATDSSHDYYHYVSEYIKGIKNDALFDKISGITFESATSEDTADSWMHNTLSEKLSKDIELVLIQLSDNVNTEEKTATFKKTCAKLIQYIRIQCPKARVAWVSAWYYTSEKQNIISQACENYSAKFISITDLVKTENKGSIEDEIHKDDGSTVTVDSTGAASHPGNRGMRLIANRILYDLGISNTDTTYDESYDN